MIRLFSFFLCISLVIFGCNHDIVEQDGMILVKGDGETASFWMDISPVTVQEFKEFVQATNFVTEAEKFGDAGVFDFPTGEWKLLKGANWKFPFGPDSALAKPNHPVTQISWNDAVAYCTWKGKRLPTSREYILAEKNGNKKNVDIYHWGNESIIKNKYKTNYWQGSFPYYNSVADGFLTTSPVGYFGKSVLGLHDIEGNVWQWCSDESTARPGEMNQRGGSYLCDPAVCHGFKIGGSASSTAETSLCHVGFRGVRSE